jgi:ribonuclease Z
MKLTILGCYSGAPRTHKNPTAQVLELKGHLFLIDCGEGTQVQLRKSKVKFSRIKHIFISHLHGDHFFGLVGLIATFRLLGRVADLHIYGPEGIKEAILFQLKIGNSYTNYKLYFHELKSTRSELIFEDEKVSVTTIPLDHRVYTNGFLFTEKVTERKLAIDKLLHYNIDVSYYKSVKLGKDATNDAGVRIDNCLLTLDPPPPKKYAFCSDTKYKEEIIPIIENATALYHESTFLEEHGYLCNKTMHSSAKQAATIAKKSRVKTLILGHYSSRYSDISVFRDEAMTIFESVQLADDGKTFNF